MNTPQPMPMKKKAKPQRSRHVPVRTCVACKKSEAKRGLVRIVRTPEAGVVVDERGKANGRGAYLCRNRTCWEAGLKKGALERALKVTISDEDRAVLLTYMEGIPADEDEGEEQSR
jgi:uncharacterized protein